MGELGIGRAAAVVRVLVMCLALELAAAAAQPAHAAAPDRDSVLLDSVGAYVTSQPEVPGTLILGAAVSQDGHWTLINRAGERLTAAGPVEFGRVLAMLAPAVPTDDPGQVRLTLVLSEATLFLHRETLKDLPKAATWRTMVDGRVYPVLKGRRGDAADALFVEVRPRVVVAVKDRPAFDEAVWQLARPLKRADIRIVALEPGGPQALAPVARMDAGTGRPQSDSLDPAALAGALRSVAGQTVIVSGKSDGGRLLVRAGSGLGADASVSVAEIEQAATDADVNLVILKSTTSRQPGSRNWLWLRVEVKGLASAIDRTSLGDFLTALMPDGAEMQLAATLANDRRTAMTATTVPVSSSAIAAGISGAVGEALSTAMTGVTGQITLTGIDATVRSAARSRELDRRILPGVNSLGQYGFVALLLAGLAGLPVALRWFGRLWPAERRDEYEGGAGYWAARAVRGLVFVAFGLPLLAVPALLATLLGWLRRGMGAGKKAAVNP